MLTSLELPSNATDLRIIDKPCQHLFDDYCQPLADFLRMVQTFTVESIAEIRRALGMNRRQLAAAVGASIRSVLNWECGHTLPDRARRKHLRNLMRARGLTKCTHGAIPVRRYDPLKMSHYLGRPKDAGLDWKRMNWQQRNAWWATRSKYRRLLADMEAGRVLGVPIAQTAAQLLDRAPDLLSS